MTFGQLIRNVKHRTLFVVPCLRNDSHYRRVAADQSALRRLIENAKIGTRPVSAMLEALMWRRRECYASA
jgi:hypothetical protein